jgi:hypothetical protein
LHLGNETPPWAYIELVLCRDVYHCTRRELYEMDPADVLLDLDMLEIETEIKNLHRFD